MIHSFSLIKHLLKKKTTTKTTLNSWSDFILVTKDENLMKRSTISSSRNKPKCKL